MKNEYAKRIALFVDINSDLKRLFSVLCAMNGASVAEVIRSFVLAYCEEHEHLLDKAPKSELTEEAYENRCLRNSAKK